MKTDGGFLITQIKQIQGRVFEKMLVDAGIQEFNGAQGRILYVLWNEDNLPIVELSRRTGLAKTTLTSMLDRLEGSGFVNREFDKNDRRKIRIVLTYKAHQLRDRYNNVSDRMNEVFYRNFTEEEITEFEQKLRCIIKNLSEVERTK